MTTDRFMQMPPFRKRWQARRFWFNWPLVAGGIIGIGALYGLYLLARGAVRLMGW